MNELIIRIESVNPVCTEQSTIQYRERWHKLFSKREKSIITDPRDIMSFLSWAVMKLPKLSRTSRFNVNRLFHSGVLDSSSEYFRVIKSIEVIPHLLVYSGGDRGSIVAFEYQTDFNDEGQLFYSNLNCLLISLFSAFDDGMTASEYYSSGFNFEVEIRNGGCLYSEVSFET
ncbi:MULTISPECIES: hypothetical protein [unclassified Pseudoalteromonas]|uniref:hypothetical protein n=1 Tax=unclassified Pseudoalteromonas TaxID=194690 RepID=UPI003014D807